MNISTQIRNLKIYDWWDNLFKVRHPFINKLENSKFFARFDLDIFLKRIEPGSYHPIHHYYMLTIQCGHFYIFSLAETPEKKYDIWFLRILFLQLYVFWLFGLPLFSALFKHYPRYDMSFSEIELNMVALWWEIPPILEEVTQFLLKEDIYPPFPKNVNEKSFEFMFYIPFNFAPRICEDTNTIEKCVSFLIELFNDKAFMLDEYLDMLYFYFINTGLPAERYKHVSKRDLIVSLFIDRYTKGISLLTLQVLLSDWFVDFEKIRLGFIKIHFPRTPEGIAYRLNSKKEYLKRELNLTDMDLEILSNTPPPKDLK